MSQFRLGEIKINLDRQKVTEFFRDSNGPIARGMLIQGERVRVATVASLKAGFPANFLSPRIVKRVVIEADGPHVLVGAAGIKTRPHRIDGNPTLVFFWPKAGRVVTFRHVNHPGSDFSRYLLERLHLALEVTKGQV